MGLDGMDDFIHIRLVKCNDWQVLYVNGEKEYEEHKIQINQEFFDTINCMLQCGSINMIDFAEIWVTDEYMEDYGCPYLYAEIPDKVIITD